MFIKGCQTCEIYKENNLFVTILRGHALRHPPICCDLGFGRYILMFVNFCLSTSVCQLGSFMVVLVQSLIVYSKERLQGKQT